LNIAVLNVRHLIHVLLTFETSSSTTPYTFHTVLFSIANARGYCCPVQNCLSTFDLFISDSDDVQNNYN